MGRPSRSISVLIACAIAAVLLGCGKGSEGEGRIDGTVTSGPEAELLAGLTDAQKVEQLIMTGFDGGEPELPIAAPGAVFVAAANWPGGEAGAALVAGLRDQVLSAGGIAPLIATRQEGGAYRELADLPPEPRPIEVGDLGDPDEAEKLAAATGEALAGLGIDLNLAPIADVASLDSPIADRAFSDDAETAAQMTAATVRGCRDAGILCAVGHFPGLGGASQDTNEGPATVGVDPGTLASRDLVPFRAAFEERVPAVVLSHAFYSVYDPVTPASLVPEIATGLLRDELGFEGVAITDDLGAGAVRSQYLVEEAAVFAIAAGADMVQVRDPSAAVRVRKAVLAALEEGRLEPARVDEAAARVLAMKASLARP